MSETVRWCQPECGTAPAVRWEYMVDGEIFPIVGEILPCVTGCPDVSQTTHIACFQALLPSREGQWSARLRAVSDVYIVANSTWSNEITFPAPIPVPEPALSVAVVIVSLALVVYLEVLRGRGKR
jgi:hypothetical protein